MKEKSEKGAAPAESKGGGKKGKAAKQHLHQVITTKAKDGSWMHEHVYKKHPDDAFGQPPVFAGTSQDVDDLHQHVDDHWGGGAAAGSQGEPDGDEGAAPAPAAGGGDGAEEPAAD